MTEIVTIGKRGSSKTPSEVEGYRCGEVVRLKSGGPLMTVEKAVMPGSDGKPRVLCRWAMDGGDLASADFPVAMLMSYAELPDVEEAE